MFVCRARPTPNAFSGTCCVITEPAAVVAPFIVVDAAWADTMLVAMFVIGGFYVIFQHKCIAIIATLSVINVVTINAVFANRDTVTVRVNSRGSISTPDPIATVVALNITLS